MLLGAPRVRFTALAILLTCPWLSGCFVGGYAYPSVQVIPRTKVGPEVADEVHAFRVDILDNCGSVEMCSSDDYLFREVGLNSRGDVPCLASAKLGIGWWSALPRLSYRQRLHPTMRLRLYRPGYETVEVKPWRWRREVEWKAAATPEAREKSVDDLISTRETNDIYKISPEAWQHSGVDYSLGMPKTEAQRAALQFVAGEYARLGTAARAQGNAEAGDRLDGKSRLIAALCRDGGAQ
jgi:hypothetical protein